MTPERARAYRRVMRTLADLGPAKLLQCEQDEIRTAADTLIFTRDASEARQALAGIEHLSRDLIVSGRWHPVTAERLVEDVAGCGPAAPAALPAAA